MIGATVGADAVRARFVFGLGNDRIVFVNDANEVFFHRVRNNTIDPHVRYNGQAVGLANDRIDYVLPESNRQHVLVVTGRGNLYRFRIVNDVVQAAEQIPGAPVATAGQDQLFMFHIGNQLINVTQQGEVWAHEIGRTVNPPQRLGIHAITAPRVVRHVFLLGRTAYVVSDQGEVYAHNINPMLGEGRLLRSRLPEVANQSTRFAFVHGTRLYAVGANGEVWFHELAPLARQSGAPPAEGQPAPAGGAPAPAGGAAAPAGGAAAPAGGAAPTPAPAPAPTPAPAGQPRR